MSARLNERTLSWVVTVLASAYVLWTTFSLAQRVPTFAKTFHDLGAELPLLTRLVLGVGRPAIAWPLALAVVTFLVVKEFRVKPAGARLALSAIVCVITALVAAIATHAIIEPMRRLMTQIG